MDGDCPRAVGRQELLAHGLEAPRIANHREVKLWHRIVWPPNSGLADSSDNQKTRANNLATEDGPAGTNLGTREQYYRRADDVVKFWKDGECLIREANLQNPKST